MTRFRVKGINDDQDTCECCGKSGLKRVVWIEDTETLEVRHFGTTCATNINKAFGITAEIKKAVREYDAQKKQSDHESLRLKIVALCKLASDTYTGEMKQGRFGMIPVDSSHFESHKQSVLAKGMAT